MQTEEDGGEDETGGRRGRFYIPNKTDQTDLNSEDTKALVANLLPGIGMKQL